MFVQDVTEQAKVQFVFLEKVTKHDIVFIHSFDSFVKPHQNPMEV